MRSIVLFLLMMGVIVGGVAEARSTDVPRILLVGDSWATAMQALRSFEMVFAESGTFENIGQRGTQTTYIGVMADEFDTTEWETAVQQDLANHPTLDIVVLSLGGNDFVHSHWTPSMPSETINAFIDAVNAHIANVIDVILAVRPNIRIAVCGYDFVSYEINGATPLQTNTIWAESERRKFAMTQTKDRTYYVHNLGLMQYYYGIPDDADPPIAPYTLPMPGGYAENYLPFPGGDPNYYTPDVALLDAEMHLSITGYDLLAQRCVSEFIATWLAWPVVYEILPLDGKDSGQSTFRVTFNKTVTGVDVSDFAAGGGASIASVSGSGAVYTVTVNLNSETAPGTLAVVDDDSIADTDGKALGGPGTGNGSFSANGALVYTDIAADGQDDFDTALEIIVDLCSPYLWQLDGLSFAPAYCDVNGGAFTMDPIGVQGNGMLDSCELAMIRACLRATTLDLSGTGGLTHTMVVDAWNHNLTQMTADMGGANGRLEKMLPGISTLFAGLMTLGDSASTQLPILLATLVSSYTALPAGVSAPSIENYICLGDYLAAAGDADGDGATNKQEYNYYYPEGGKLGYISAALDPNMVPVLPCENTSGGTYTLVEGESFCLYVPDSVDLSAGFEWLKDGYPLSDDSRITGTATRQITIAPLRLSDAGTYECATPSGTVTFLGPAVLEVKGMPAAGPQTLAVSVLMITLAGAVTLHRRRVWR